MLNFLDFFTFILIVNSGFALVIAQENEQYRQDRIDSCRENVVYDVKENYTIVYDECKEQPIKASYTIFPNKEKVLTRKKDGGRFFTEDYIWTSDNRDYRNNKYDRGHLLASSARRYDRKLYRATFSFINVALQVDQLNRGVWRDLEVEVQQLSDSLDIEIPVEIEVLFSENSERLKTGAIVPDAFKKIYLDKCIIFVNKSNSKREKCQQ